jgi:hypothetical protein
LLALLADLLLSLFQAPQLRQFLASRLREDLTGELPESPTTPNALAHAAAGCLSARGLVGEELFAALIRERPERAEDIRSVQRALSLPGPARDEPRRPLLGSGVDTWLGGVLTTAPPVHPTHGRPGRPPEDWLDRGLLPPPTRNNPASLLHARRRVVPFHGWLRAAETAALRAWWQRDDPVAIHVVVGPGGVGKTRLSLELSAQAREDGFAAGFVPARATESDFAGLFAADACAVAIVDYAETRPAIGRWLERAAERAASGEQRTRIVLVVRALGDWWEALLRNCNSELDALLRASDPIMLDPDALDDDARARIYAESAAQFARILGVAQPTAPCPDLSSPRFGRVLYLHMAALAAVEERSSTVHTLLADTLRRERQFWSRELPGGDWSSDHMARRLHRDIDRAVAALALAGGADSDERVDVLLARSGVDLTLRNGLKQRIIDLYPGTGDDTSPRAHVSPLEPDLLAEAHVATVLLDRANAPDFVPSLFAGDPPGAVLPALELLGRVAGDPAEVADGETERLDRCLRSALSGLIAGDLDGRAAVALAVAVGLAERRLRCPLAEVLDDLVRKQGTPALAESLAAGTIPLAVSTRPVCEWILRTASATEDPEKRFRALIRLAAIELGQERRDAAHTTILRACEAAQAWSSDESEALWSTALGTGLMGLVESEIGEIESAVQRTRESLVIFDALSGDIPAERREMLCLYLHLGHGIALLRSGARVAAIEVLRNVEAGYAALAAEDPSVAAAEQALTDFCLGQALGEGGRHSEAAVMLRRAVLVQRALAAEQRGTRLSELANSLVYLCDAEKRIGNTAAALAAGQDAVRLWQELADADPEAAAPSLAYAQLAVASTMITIGDHASARTAAACGVEMLRPLARRRGRVFAAVLVSGLNILGLALAGAEHRSAALAAFSEAQSTATALTAAHPEVNAPLPARCLLLQAIWQKDHDRAGAIASIRAALASYRGLPDEIASCVTLERGVAAVMLAWLLVDHVGSGEVISVLSEAIAAMERAPDAGSSNYLIIHGTALFLRAMELFAIDEAEQAVAGLVACVAPLRAALPANAAAGVSLATALRVLARDARSRGDSTECERLLGEVISRWCVIVDTDPGYLDDLVEDLIMLADLRREGGAEAEARELLHKAERALRGVPEGKCEAIRASLANSLAALAEREPSSERRLVLLREGLALAVAHFEADTGDPVEHLERICRLTEALAKASQIDEAVQILERAISRARRLMTPEQDDVRDCLTDALEMLADLHERRSDLVSSLGARRTAVDLWRRRVDLSQEHRVRFAETLESLAEALEEQDRAGEARVVRAELKAVRGKRPGRARRRRR